MSVFSEKLSQLAKKKEIKIYQFAEHCGLDRSTVYKYLKGTRSVNSLELVNQFAEALQLDPTQTDDLIAAYKISRMGDENYFRRRKVLEFFNSLCPALFQPENTALISPLSTTNSTIPRGCQVYKGEEQVNAVVQVILSTELGKADGMINIIAQPEYQFLFQVLNAIVTISKCKIQHIVCLENSDSMNAALYNLDCLKTVTKSLLSQRSYIPFYFYDSVSAHFRNNMLLPYLLVTSTCAIQISHDVRRAVYYTDKEHITFFQSIFTDALKRSHQMVERLDNIEDNLKFYLTQYIKSGQPQGACNAEPCLVPYLDRAMLEKYTRPIEHRAELIDLFAHYIEEQRKVVPPNDYADYFSTEGVDYFCRTGYMWQIPNFAVMPLELSDRYEILRRFRNNRIITNTRMLKENSSLLLGKLEAVVWRDGSTSFVYEHSPDQYTAFYLSEKSLSFCFADFFTYIRENDMAYDNEESMKFIQTKMEELKHKLHS